MSYSVLYLTEWRLLRTHFSISSTRRPISEAFSWCSQRRMTRQPSASNWILCLLSLHRLSSIFSIHQCRCDLGGVKCCGQPCQKQPSTKTPTRSLGKTMSAEILRLGVGRQFLRKRRPRRKRALRSVTSAVVSTPGTALIILRTVVEDALGARDLIELTGLPLPRQHLRATIRPCCTQGLGNG